MKRHLWMAAALALVGGLLLVTPALGASGHGLRAWVAASGGSRLPSGGYALTGCIGQGEAGPTWSSGPYALNGGFLAGAAGQWWVLLPLIVR